jgi:hypothetical protein
MDIMGRMSDTYLEIQKDFAEINPPLSDTMVIRAEELSRVLDIINEELRLTKK